MQATRPNAERSSAAGSFRSFLGSDRGAALAVFGVAGLVRLFYLVDSSDNPTFLFPVVDAYAYDRLARKLASGTPPGNSLFWQPLLYPHFLAAMYALFDHGILAAKIVQSLIGAGTCALTFWVGRIALSRRVGLLAGLILAFYGPVIFFETELLGTGLGLFWAVLLLLLLLLAARPAPAFLFLALGACGALATLTRPPLLAFFLVGCAVLALEARRKLDGHALAQRLVLVGIGFTVVALPVGAATQRRTGHFGILPSSAGINLYIGNNPRWEETVTARPDRSWKEITALPKERGIRDPWEQSRFFRRQVVAYFRDDPAAFLGGLLRKTVRFASSREIPRNVDLYVYRKWSSLLGLLTWKIGPWGFPFGLLWPLAVFGLVASWRRVPLALWALLVTYPAVIILYFVSARYRVLVVPGLAVLAAAGALELADAIRGRRWRRLLPASLVVLGVAAASCLPTEFPEEVASTSYEAELYRTIGREALEEGRYAEAIRHLDEALRIAPDFADAWNDMGAAFLGQEREDEAISALEKAIALEPAVTLYLFNLGFAYLEKGDLPEAERHFRRAVEIDPAYLPAQMNLGICLFDQGRFDEAIERFRLVVQTDPHAPRAVRARRLLREAMEIRGRDREDPSSHGAMPTRASPIGGS